MIDFYFKKPNFVTEFKNVYKMTAYASLSKIIAHNGEHVSDTDRLIELNIKEKMSNLLDSIAFILPKRGVNATFKKLASDIFSLRFDVLPLIKAFDKSPNLEPTYTPKTSLEKLVADIMPIFELINVTIINSNPSPIYRISLDELPAAWSFMPSWEAQRLTNFVDDSLKVELGLLIADLIHDGKIELNADQTEELRLFLRTAFERYAAQSITLGILQPDTFAKNQLMRNIIIVKSTMDTNLRLNSTLVERGEWTNFKEQYA